MRLYLNSIIRAINTPKRKGQIGEGKIALQLELLNRSGMHGRILTNLYLPMYNGQTAETDLVFITPKGLIVIESKYYSGYISGDEETKDWTSTLYVGRTTSGDYKTEKHQFYNPVKQNQMHIHALKDYLCLDVPFYSIIIFADRCNISNVSISSKNVYVCQHSSLSQIISHIWNTCPNVLDEQQIISINSTLQPLTNPSISVKAQHIQNVKQSSQASHLCPLCGNPLVQRTARRGSNAGSIFWGCSNFPSCKYTKSC